MTVEVASTADPTATQPPAAAELRQKVELLQSYVESSIKDIGKKRKINQGRATLIKVCILCLSGGATVLLGLDLGTAVEPTLKNLAFAFTSVVTLLNALEPFFNYRALWVEHERANAAFFQVKDRISYYVTGKADADLSAVDVDRFYGEYERVWESLNHAWSSQRQKYDETGVPSKM